MIIRSKKGYIISNTPEDESNTAQDEVEVEIIEDDQDDQDDGVVTKNVTVTTSDGEVHTF